MNLIQYSRRRCQGFTPKASTILAEGGVPIFVSLGTIFVCLVYAVVEGIDLFF